MQLVATLTEAECKRLISAPMFLQYLRRKSHRGMFQVHLHPAISTKPPRNLTILRHLESAGFYSDLTCRRYRAPTRSGNW